MRIRRRPQTISLQHSSDPTTSTSTAPQTPLLQNAARSREWMQGGKDEGRMQLLHRARAHANVVDLGKKSRVARRLLALPQDSGLDRRRRHSPGGDAHRSVVDGDAHGGMEEKGGSGDGSKSELAGEVGETTLTLSNGAAAAAVAAVATLGVVVAVKDEKIGGGNGGGGGTKKRRGGAAVLMERSRCSRVNGRGWRCGQPTLVGYALCEHHLGKGRMRSVTGCGGGGASQLGRTEHRSRTPAASPNADEPEPGQRRS
ncbi:hypothetical protein GUJ93_ZPchr0012g20329 [Zizania palustris]|uniref:WRC domain-containing protein n=1 Tax=Zizania palustris TaxID=103762 RepID=A0A8J5WMV3_ZIZPA|nr:hypothetical protein GUJ93_ZPchr0012g20329 [Zizania palustris]